VWVRFAAVIGAAASLAIPLAAQDSPVPPTLSVLIEAAQDAESAEAYHRALGSLVKLAHEAPDQGSGVLEAIREEIRTPDPLRKAIAVDVVQDLPVRLRDGLAPTLEQLLRGEGDSAAGRLYVRGLAEVGEAGRAVLRRLLRSRVLTGDTEALARMYVGG
jgi:hypothetical protein